MMMMMRNMFPIRDRYLRPTPADVTTPSFKFLFVKFHDRNESLLFLPAHPGVKAIKAKSKANTKSSSCYPIHPSFIIKIRERFKN